MMNIYILRTLQSDGTQAKLIAKAVIRYLPVINTPSHVRAESRKEIKHSRCCAFSYELLERGAL